MEPIQRPGRLLSRSHMFFLKDQGDLLMARAFFWSPPCSGRTIRFRANLIKNDQGELQKEARAINKLLRAELILSAGAAGHTL